MYNIDKDIYGIGHIVSIMGDRVVQESYLTKRVNMEWVQINNEE